MAPSRVDDLPPEVRATYEALRAKFRSGLAARWREIEHAGSATERCAALHRLAGAAGGYGFDEIGAAARSAERLAAAGPGPELDRALAALRRVMHEAEGAA